MIGLSGLSTIFRTTLTDQLRDRRSVGAALIYALLGPVVMLLAFSALADQEKSGESPKLAVHGAEHAPALLARIERGGATVERRSGGAPAEVAGADAVLVIPGGFDAALAAGRPAGLVLLRDERRQSSAAGAARIAEQVREHGREATARALGSRGLSPALADPVAIEERNVAPVSGRAVAIVGMMLYFFILAPFFTSMTAAIDATAGERERQSLKPLMAQPIDPGGLIGGKWAVAALFGVAGTTVTIFFGTFLLGFAPLEKLGVDLPLRLAEQAQMALLLGPLALAVAAVQSLVALLAKSFKEAQTYIQLLSLAPVGVLFTTTFSGSEPGELARAMPLTGHADLLRGLLTEGRLDWTQALLVTASSLALAGICLWISRRHVTDERLLGQS